MLPIIWNEKLNWVIVVDFIEASVKTSQYRLNFSPHIH